MTREEAIKRLKTTDACDSELCEALDMAIKALEQQPTDAVDRATIKEYLYSLDMGIKVTTEDDVLGKIRTEIDSYCSDNRDRNDGLYIAMRIIDKYQASPTEAEGSEK